MSKVKTVLSMILVFLVCFISPNLATSADNYPTKPISLVVPYGPGGSCDMSARPLAKALSKLIKVPVTVINKPGAGGSIGTSYVVNSKPDGYTLVNASIGPCTIKPHMSDVGYSHKDLTPIAQITEIPLALAVSSDSDIKSLDDFIKASKERQIKVGTPGSGNIQHVALEDFFKNRNFSATHMPYQGANAAVAALLGGHVDATLTGVTEVASHYKNGTFRILGVMSKEECPLLPGAPTFMAQGYDMEFGIWYGVFGPKGMPEEIVNYLSENIKAAIADNEVTKAWDRLFLIKNYQAPGALGARVKRDSDKNSGVLSALGLAK